MQNVNYTPISLVSINAKIVNKILAIAFSHVSKS